MKKYTLWFTLIELIVVITILAILWTLWFMSFQWYTMNARDSVRISDIKLIEKSLGVYVSQQSKYPLPDNYFTIEAQWQIIWYQWVVWIDVSRSIDITSIPKDPSLDQDYSYSLDKDNLKYGIFAFFESEF